MNKCAMCGSSVEPVNDFGLCESCQNEYRGWDVGLDDNQPSWADEQEQSSDCVFHFIEAPESDSAEFWYKGAGWYWADECGDLCGPYESEVLAKRALDSYAEREFGCHVDIDFEGEEIPF